MNPSTSVAHKHASPEDAARIKAAAAWVQNLSRTLKTCRLYDATNPAVIRFRAQLYTALGALLEEHGELALRFTSDDVTLDGESLYPARSREDNIALAFFRDGIRSLTMCPGITREELDALLDGLLHVTVPSHGEDDLVTLLWQANLTHVKVEHTSSDADVLGSGAENEQSVPWPAASGVDETTDEAGHADGAAQETGTAESGGPNARRSDDWDIGQETADFEAAWRALVDQSQAEVERFRREYANEHERPTVSLANALATAYAAADASPADLLELARFQPRVLRSAIAAGDWRGATEAIAVLGRCGPSDWSPVSFAQELNQPISVSGIVQWLDQQGASHVDDFVALTGVLDTPGVDLLNQVLVELQNPIYRARLTEAVAQACKDQPERLAPWLSDPREWVVKHVVNILGTIGTPAIVGLLRAVALHPDPKVRVDVAGALKRVETPEARDILVRMLADSHNDARTFCVVLQGLSDRRDPAIAMQLIGFIKDSGFERRSDEEQRAVYMALAATGGDEVVPEIEAELHRTGWFARGPDPHRQSLGRCLARIGTPVAREALERGASSRKPVVRKSCEDALEAMRRHG